MNDHLQVLQAGERLTAQDPSAPKYEGMGRQALIALLEKRDEESVLESVFERVTPLLSGDIEQSSDAPLYYRGKERLVIDKVNPVRLKPLPELSFHDDLFGDNLIIAGDNLQVMRSLLVDYRNMVDVIYIDPPYNTGTEEFPYNDNFMATREELRAMPRQIKERTAVVSAEDPNKHTKWVSHMAPRLFAAKKLLKSTGVIMVSIDEHELPRLWLLMNEMFGEGNRLATMIWEKSRKNDASYISEGHEYILVWAKSRADLDRARQRFGKWRELKPGFDSFMFHFHELLAEHPDDVSEVERGLREFVSSAKRGKPLWTVRQYVHVDENSHELGPYKEEDPSWPGGGGPKYDLIHPETGEVAKTPTKGWIWSDPAEAQAAIDNGIIVWKRARTGALGIPKVKKYLLSGREKEL